MSALSVSGFRQFLDSKGKGVSWTDEQLRRSLELAASRSKFSEGVAAAPGRMMIDVHTWDRIWHDEDSEGNKYIRYGIATGSPLTSNMTMKEWNHVGSDKFATATFHEDFPHGPSYWLDPRTGEQFGHWNPQWEPTSNESFFATCGRDAKGRCVAGEGGSDSSDPSSQEVDVVLGDLPRTRGYLAWATHALRIAKSKAMSKLHALAGIAITADVIPIASDFAREALLKGAGQSNPLQGVPLQDVATIASKALAWAWTKVKGKLFGKRDVPTANAALTSEGLRRAVDAVEEIFNLLAEMMGHDLERPSREEIEAKLNGRPVANQVYPAHQVDQAAAEVDPNPTQAQRDAGNYRKGHLTVQGLPITIETAKGVKRKPHHEKPLAWHYGYIKRTESEADGDHVDVFLGPDLESDKVHVVDQLVRGNTDATRQGVFDEHKVMLGFHSKREATDAYHANYPDDWRGFGGITELTMSQFKEWLERGDTSRPIQEVALPLVRNDTPNPDRLQAFQAWLRTQFTDVGLTDEQLWTRYAAEGFRKGQARVWDDSKGAAKALFSASADPKQAPRGMDFYDGTRDQFLRSSFNSPVAVAKVKVLAGRAYDELKNVTYDMATKIQRTLTDGLTQGKNPKVIARDMTEQVEISRKRALVISRTEISRAHASGQLQALRDLGMGEVGVDVEWLTSGTPCPECAAHADETYSIEDAEGLLPWHPQCRCVWKPSTKRLMGKMTKNTWRSPDFNAARKTVQAKDERGRFAAGGSHAHLAKLKAAFPGATDEKLQQMHDRLSRGEMSVGFDWQVLPSNPVAKVDVRSPSEMGPLTQPPVSQPTPDWRSVPMPKPVGEPRESVDVRGTGQGVPNPAWAGQALGKPAMVSAVARLAAKNQSFVRIHELHDALGQPDLASFHKTINDLRRSGLIDASEHEGRHGITEREQETAILEPRGSGSHMARITGLTVPDMDKLRRYVTVNDAKGQSFFATCKRDEKGHCESNEGGSSPAPSAKAKIAKAAHKMVDREIQRYAEEHNESRFVKVVGGRSLPDCEPVDVIAKNGDGIELKTMVDNANDKLTMDSYAQIRKIKWEQDSGKTFHTVVSDDRLVYDADGPGKHDDSKRVYHYRRGVAGSARVGTMHRCKDEAELRKLMAMPEEDLPEAARRTDGKHRVGKWVAFEDEQGKGFRNTRTKKEYRAKR